jgi:hypothetical protein
MGARACHADALAKELRLSRPHLLRFLRGLANIGICEELADGRFALTGLGRSLCHGAPSRLAEKAEIAVGQYWRPWAELVHTLRTGEPAFQHVFGTDVVAWRREHGEQGALFNAYLAEENFATAGPIVEALDLSGVKTVADICGGHGGMLAALLAAHDHLDGVLFDMPETVKGALSFLQSRGVVSRVIPIGGDIRAAVPAEADLYLLKGVLQQWDDDNAALILRNCRKAMRPQAKLVVIERLLPAHAAEDPAAIMLDLHMMTITGGRARTLAEFEALLSEAGFSLARATPTDAGFSVIEARPA